MFLIVEVSGGEKSREVSGDTQKVRPLCGWGVIGVDVAIMGVDIGNANVGGDVGMVNGVVVLMSAGSTGGI